jgi:hypothetical protein
VLAAAARRRTLGLDGEIAALSGPRPDFTLPQRRMTAGRPGAGLLATVPVTLIVSGVLRSGRRDSAAATGPRPGSTAAAAGPRRAGLAAVIAAAFNGGAIAVTVAEGAAGKPLSAAVQGKPGHGTTFGGGSVGTAAPASPSPSTTGAAATAPATSATPSRASSSPAASTAPAAPARGGANPVSSTPDSATPVRRCDRARQADVVVPHGKEKVYGSIP